VGSSDTWRIHLNAALYILPAADKAFHSDQIDSLSTTYKHTYHFFSAALMWYSIQSWATTGDMIVAEPADFPRLGQGMSLSNFTGCEEWVTHDLFNAIKLAHWKETIHSKKQLSHREPTKCALEIDANLNSGLNALLPRIERLADCNLFEDHHDYIKLLVTRIYGYSTLIYLYTIESGPRPDVDEIHANVSKTIEAFQALPKAQLIRNLSWPFCIAGSMAVGNQQTAFLEIAVKAKISRCPFGSPKHAVAIIKECWNMRTNGSSMDGNVDWRIAMRNLDLNILLT
jgi:hypothetical protein